MNETLDETLAHYNDAGVGILRNLRQHAFDRDEFGIVNGLKLQITTMLLTQLAAPYHRKDLKLIFLAIGLALRKFISSV